MHAAVAESSTFEKQNDRHLYLDIFWWGILGGTLVSFLGIYLTRIGASSLQISVMTAGPAVINLLISLPAGKWLEGRSFVRAVFTTSILHRVGYILILLVMMVFTTQMQISLVLVITVVMSIPGSALMIAFNALFADLVPPERRGVVVGRRNALLALSMTTSGLIAGQMLERIVFPLNYQIVFFIGIIGGALSCYELSRVRQRSSAEPSRVGKPMLDRARPGAAASLYGRRYIPGMRFLTRGADLLRVDLLRSEFGLFLFAMFSFYVSQNLAVPLFPIYSVDMIGLSDWLISVGTSLFQLAVFFASMGLGRASSRFGHHRLMVYSLFGFSIFPILVGISPTVPAYMIGLVFGGVGWGYLSGSLANRLMERVPADDRPAHMALFNITLNLGVLAGSLLAPFIGDWVGLQAAMIIAGVARLITMAVLWRWG